MPSQNTNVFVSYSHADASLVAPVVKLLRVNKALVFQDIDDIQPGKRWRGEIARGLAESHLVVIFWCAHASRSDEVSKEWKAAIEQEKDLLPLLLDTTPLPQELGEFQWIDFQKTVGPRHGSDVSSANEVMDGALPPPPHARVISLRFLLIGVAAAIFVVAAVWWRIAKDGGILLPLAVLVGVLGFIQNRRSNESARPHPRELERRIASEIETEIIRRTALRRNAGA